MALLLQTLLLLFALHGCVTKVLPKLVRCSDLVGNNTANFTPSQDDVPGRYLLELCLKTSVRARRWDTDIKYHTKDGYERHSGFKAELNLQDLGCPVKNNTVNICLSKDLDLVFKSLYQIRMYIRDEDSIVVWNNKYSFEIDNNYTLVTFTTPYVASSFISASYDDEENVMLEWNFHNIPLTDYVIELCPNSTHEITERCTSVHSNCSLSSWNTLRCALRPRVLCRLELTHTAPWTNGDLSVSVHAYDETMCLTQKNGNTTIVVPAGWGGTWWAAGGAGAGLLGGLVLWMRRRRHMPKLIPKPPIPSEAPGGCNKATEGCVLLVYAREGDKLQRVVDCLGDMLRAAGVQQVWDIHSPRTCAAAATMGEGQWLRGIVREQGGRAMLLQTALLTHMHERRLQHSSPQYSDLQLLPAALQLLQEAPHNYTRTYIATFEDETVHMSWLESWVTPLRLHSIPLGVTDLLRNMTGVTPVSRDVLRLTAAVDDYVKHVNQTPGYYQSFLIDVS